MLKHLAAGAVLLALASPAFAECDPTAGQAEIKACLDQDLRASDRRINAVYKVLMGHLDEAGRKDLRDRQRAWLKQRDRACQLDNSLTDREQWMQAILRDTGKTLCVVRYTYGRVGELDALMKAKAPQAPAAALPEAPSAPPPPPAAAVSTPAALPAGLVGVDDGYKLRSLASHRSGKWYYEVRYDIGGIAQLGDMLLSGGFAGPESNVGSMMGIRRKQTSAPPVVMGYAIDLDEGRYYVRVNGMWRMAPGSSRGLDVKLNRNWRAMVDGSSEVTDLIRRGLVQVDLGAQPFRYALPDGYRPFAEP